MRRASEASEPVYTYNRSSTERALLPDTAALLLDLKLLLLIGIANGAALIGHTLFGARWAWPLDGGIRLGDQPLFGPSKTIRGLLLALVMTPIAALVVGLSSLVGILIGAFAMFGDVCSSFLKRRLGFDVHAQALGIDQIPESLFPLLAVQPVLQLTTLEIVALVLAFLIMELAISRVLYRLRLRDQPY